MRASKWNDYEIIDTGNGKKLERFKDIVLIRPDPQVIWDKTCSDAFWKKAHGEYIRSKNGGGNWKFFKTIPDIWKISYGNYKYLLKPMGFKHMGIFPEQATNWDFLHKIIQKPDKQANVLNLFAYTGGATIACLGAGAKVCHVDSSKGITAYAKDNLAVNNLQDKPVRFIVDDCVKFVKREIRRGHKYDGIIMDPPSYGRGANGEIWKFESDIYALINLCSQLLSEDALFFSLNSYTSGFSPTVTRYLLGTTLKKSLGGYIFSDEIGLPVSSSGFVLPCGNTAVWLSDKKLGDELLNG